MNKKSNWRETIKPELLVELPLEEKVNLAGDLLIAVGNSLIIDKSMVKKKNELLRNKAKVVKLQEEKIENYRVENIGLRKQIKSLKLENSALKVVR